ncbi:MAG: aldo/keto reductase [Helicobacteraceae bacterium]|jgi:aryl-alcohol dehydrogenase-like predicted oxidoreductase|nr:aldo/keto reductase [Helicobacteraceae bacterium]
MKVSAIGLRMMGTNYHRGPYPDRKIIAKLVDRAVELGVNCFDAGENYGPYTNEELTGELPAPFKSKVQIGAKFGHRHVNALTAQVSAQSRLVK